VTCGPISASNALRSTSNNIDAQLYVQRSQIGANQAQAAAPLTMSIGKNTRKPVAAASAMPKTIDNAKSDMEAQAYNNSAIAGLVLADAGDVIAFRWRGGAERPIPSAYGSALARRRPIQLSHAPSSRSASTAAAIACMRATSLRRSQFGGNLIVKSLEPDLDLDGEICKLARCP
jgi:hypothetical protein